LKNKRSTKRHLHTAYSTNTKKTVQFMIKNLWLAACSNTVLWHHVCYYRHVFPSESLSASPSSSIFL